MSIDIKGMQESQLKILKEVKRVCEKNNITFYLAYGTCLGAVRHKGFIPWDDDIDICMRLEDFEKFKKLSKDFKEEYFLQTADTDKNYGLMIARVRMNGTTLIESDEKDNDIHHGVFIDIYPMFNCPSSKFKMKIMVLSSYLYRLLLLGRPPYNQGEFFRYASTIILKAFPKKIRRGMKQFLYRQITKYRDNGALASLYGMDVSTQYDSSWFGKPKMVEFEDSIMPIPTNSDGYLKFRYDDYMTLPPVEKRTVHHTFEFIDLNNSYKKYRGKYYLTQERDN